MTDHSQNQNNHKSDDVSLYDRLLARAEVLLQGGRINLEDSLHKASEELSSLGSYTREQVDKVKTYIRRDILHAAEKKPADPTEQNRATEAVQQKPVSFAQTVKEAIDPKRVATGAQSFFSRVITTAAGTLNEWGEKMEHGLEFTAGEVTSPGTLTCKNCGEVFKLKETAQIPLCSQCGQKSFRKSY